MKFSNFVIYCFLFIVLMYVLNSTELFVPVYALTEYKHCKHNIIFFKKVIDFLDEHNIIYWATCGTLLGAIRDKGMIPWDDDNDICVQFDHISLIEENIEDLKKRGIGWTSAWFGNKFYDLNGKKSEHEYNYPFVDVFHMTKFNDQYIYSSIKARQTWPNEYYIEHQLFPLKKITYEYYTVNSPNDPNIFLDRAYPGWNKYAVKTYDHITEKHLKRIEFPIVYNLNKKPYLWTYWDDLSGNTPSIIDLCYQTVIKHCSNSFDVVRLNSNNIKDYLPEINEYSNDVDKLQIAHKVDLYRIMLLYKYGGLYIDADTIVLKDPIEIMHKLTKYDYVGFGCSGNNCKYGYMKPSNGILASRPNTYLMGHILMSILKKIKNQTKLNYFDVGKYIIWNELKKIEEYEYYHYSNNYDGRSLRSNSRDSKRSQRSA